MSDSSDDDLGLFSFKNKKKIVSSAPLEQLENTNNGDDEVKRKKVRPPSNEEAEGANKKEECIQTSVIDTPDSSFSEVPEPNKYESIVDEICKIDEELDDNILPTRTTKKFKKCTEKRQKLVSNLENLVWRRKYTQQREELNLAASENTTEEDLIENNDANNTRTIVVKFKRGINIFRYRITYDTPLTVPLEYVCRNQNLARNCVMLQVNDERINPDKTPQELDLTVADIIGYLIQLLSEVFIGSLAESETSGSGNARPNNSITIKIQSGEHRRNTREYLILKNKPLREYLVKACMDFEYSAAIFYFDGAVIDQKFTCEELEIEDMDCIDIVPK